ncbi:MAG: ribonuclease HII [Halobellus sp.]|uniref:ribonuclease HII n=1 Tax=Halobellus sp. TaxID=1979212 RepID=UPI0035D4EB69
MTAREPDDDPTGDAGPAADETALGTDEAGKGPVLGPMVAAAVRASPASIPDDVDDSKRLTPAARTTLAATLHDSPDVDVAVAAISTDRIDDSETDMNSLTVAAQAEAVAQIARHGDRVVADAGDVSESRFARRVGDRVASDGPSVEVHAEHGADEVYPLVAAASIVAKVERDNRIEALEADYADHGPIGSGYPSDPTTREFLSRYVAETGELPDCARASWATSETVLAAAEQSGLSEF